MYLQEEIEKMVAKLNTSPTKDEIELSEVLMMAKTKQSPLTVHKMFQSVITEAQK